jgi:NADH-quinone oxidoreductase subunit C
MPADLEQNVALQQLRQFDSQAVEEALTFRDEVTLFVRPPSLVRVCEFLRDAPDARFNYLSDVTALDRHPNEPRFEVVYHLYSIERNHGLRLKVRLPGDDPRVASVVPVWPGANAFEREVYDLFGVYFEGHPDLRRILMPEEWEGYPLRKDYPTEGYR